MIISSDDLSRIIEELGRIVNEVLDMVSRVAVFDDKDINELMREVRRRWRDARLVGGDGHYNVKGKGNFEVEFVFSATERLNVIKEVVNYYTSLLVMLNQTRDVLERIGIGGGAVIIVDEARGTVNVLVGPKLATTEFLMEFPGVKERVEVPTVLSGVHGLDPEEAAYVGRVIDQYLELVSKGSVVVETTVDVKNYAYPDKIRKAEEVLMGGVV
ncbi:hypothetical protein [Vulcanisaeta thermophila]|uniref:hypothetical protein n=1 Tax=Vulcanisaeta thermophila TaxID=867917 RepID=UPI0008532D90|nr:hypothetical protein [Vulcanisaeta thermophila]